MVGILDILPNTKSDIIEKKTHSFPIAIWVDIGQGKSLGSHCCYAEQGSDSEQ